MALEDFRRAFAQTTQKGIFFDNASMGPVIPDVTRAMTHCMELRQSMPMKYYKYAQELFPACRTFRAKGLTTASMMLCARPSRSTIFSREPKQNAIRSRA